MVWKLDWKKPFYGSKLSVFKWSAKSRDFTIWIPDTHTVQYSDESGIQVFGIQMVTVHHKSVLPEWWHLDYFSPSHRGGWAWRPWRRQPSLASTSKVLRQWRQHFCPNLLNHVWKQIYDLSQQTRDLNNVFLLMLWAHIDSWLHLRRCTIFADTHSSRCTTVQQKCRQFDKTCWFAKLSE